MDLWDSLAVLVRRWYAVVPVLLLTALAAAYVALALPPTYEAKGAVLLLPPPTATGSGAPDNPYLSFGSSVSVTAGIVAQSIMSDGTAQQLLDQGLPGSYEVGLATDGNGPVLNVIVTSTVPEQAQRLKDRLCQLVSEVLKERQTEAGAPNGSFISAKLISDTPVPHKLLKSKIRAIAILGVLGLASSVLAASVADALATRRSRRRRTRSGGAGEGTVAADLSDLPDLAEPLPPALRRADDALPREVLQASGRRSG